MATTAVKRQAALRGWLSRASVTLAKLVKDANVDRFELADAIDEFDTWLRAVDGIQEEVELELEDEKLLADIEEAADYRERCKVSCVQATRLLSRRGRRREGVERKYQWSLSHRGEAS